MLVCPPENQRKVGGVHSKVWCHGRNQWTRSAACAQNASGSAAASASQRLTTGLTISTASPFQLKPCRQRAFYRLALPRRLRLAGTPSAQAKFAHNDARGLVLWRPFFP